MIPKLNTIVTEKLRPEHFGDPINQHHSSFQTNSLESLDQLRNTLPNVRWISVVVSWFATSLDGGHCEILPGVEYKNTYTSPDEWRVSHWSRATAHLVSQIDGRPQYGGTVNDASLIRYLVELRKQGFKIMLYPARDKLFETKLKLPLCKRCFMFEFRQVTIIYNHVEIKPFINKTNSWEREREKER